MKKAFGVASVSNYPKKLPAKNAARRYLEKVSSDFHKESKSVKIVLGLTTDLVVRTQQISKRSFPARASVIITRATKNKLILYLIQKI